jgi:iron complex transport system substrate-binding protein
MHLPHGRAALLLLLVATVACSSRASDAGTRGLVDDYGAPVARGTLTAPARIVSLNPTTTQILFAIGAGDRVVGRTSWDLWPDAARRVPDLGPGLRPNVEAVLAQHPDLVLLYASADNRAAASQLRAAHVPVLALKVDRIEEFRRAALIVGLATGDSARAAAVVDTVMRTLDRVRAATAHLPHPTVFWHVWDAPIITIGRGSYLTQLLEIAGGTNVYGDLPQTSPQVSLEDIIRRDPDYVLAGAEGAAHVRASAEWRAVGAVKAGRVLVVDTTLIGMPSVRLGEAAVHIARLLHPGALP